MIGANVTHAHLLGKTYLYAFERSVVIDLLELSTTSSAQYLILQTKLCLKLTN